MLILANLLQLIQSHNFSLSKIDRLAKNFKQNLFSLKIRIDIFIKYLSFIISNSFKVLMANFIKNNNTIEFKDLSILKNFCDSNSANSITKYINYYLNMLQDLQLNLEIIEEYQEILNNAIHRNIKNIIQLLIELKDDKLFNTYPKEDDHKKNALQSKEMKNYINYSKEYQKIKYNLKHFEEYIAEFNRKFQKKEYTVIVEKLKLSSNIINQFRKQKALLQGFIINLLYKKALINIYIKMTSLENNNKYLTLQEFRMYLKEELDSNLLYKKQVNYWYAILFGLKDLNNEEILLEILSEIKDIHVFEIDTKFIINFDSNEKNFLPIRVTTYPHDNEVLFSFRQKKDFDNNTLGTLCYFKGENQDINLCHRFKP